MLLRALLVLFLLAAVALVLRNTGRTQSNERPARSSHRPAAARLDRHPSNAPIPGYLLIADRGNNRLLLVGNRKQILWRYPPAAGAAYPFRRRAR